MAQKESHNQSVYIVPIGGIYVTNEPMIIQTILGSCLSITVFDYTKKVGGMNHIVLPGSFTEEEAEQKIRDRNTKYGIFGIEALFKRMHDFGCSKKTTEVRLFGASYMGNRNQIIDVAKSNVDFARAYLGMAKIKIVEEVVLKENALKILLNTQNGKIFIKEINPP